MAGGGRGNRHLRCQPSYRLGTRVLSAIAQFHKSVTVLKLSAARERLRRKGHRVSHSHVDQLDFYVGSEFLV